MVHKTIKVMKRLMILLSLLLVSGGIQAQKFITESSKISFYSEAPLEDIDAHNEKTTSIFDSDNGEIVFSIPIKDFTFKRSLMQEHFNERYMESEKYPKATFEGVIKGYTRMAGKQEAVATGKMTIHGVTKQVEIKGEMEFSNGKVLMTSKFIVKLEDYDIKIPSILFQNIAEEIEVTVDLTYKKYGNE